MLDPLLEAGRTLLDWAPDEVLAGVGVPVPAGDVLRVEASTWGEASGARGLTDLVMRRMYAPEAIDVLIGVLATSSASSFTSS